MTDPQSLIQNAKACGRKALNESESKQFLAAFGVPVCREVLASSPEAAAAEAARMGVPVVLKASGEKMMHKTEAGGVVLNVKNEQEILSEGRRLLAIPGCESLSVQEMVVGARELVCGLTRDPSFGPAVMFGLGGILTETLKDTVFRIAPLTMYDAKDMMSGIRANTILQPFRGEAAVDTELLAKILITVGEIGLQYESITEIDINPLKIRRDGKPIAVDALIVLAA
ncbi:MAG: carboxylate--amine ligase [Deltaproteobacteria bacterium HGW-Deltaproteobacteria-6]|jgi:acetyl-CoA synthetase (ADP-forming)|nr:MAG: carboxylate--amine ligase [Deltaproteobacteria bacterium HGW-Deltaproteobacteria-6]